jgi:hypothetical protein
MLHLSFYLSILPQSDVLPTSESLHTRQGDHHVLLYALQHIFVVHWFAIIGFKTLG